MSERDDLGHEPEDPDDRRFAPVTRDGDARGRTVPDGDEDASGTGVPGVDADAPDSLPPDEEGVEEAEQGDPSRRHPR